MSESVLPMFSSRSFIVSYIKSKSKMNIPYIETFPLVWGIISVSLVSLLECVQPVGRKAKI